MKIAAIIQARMGSKRFPGKVMADLCGKPVLQHVIERTKEIGIPVFLSTPDQELVTFSWKFGLLHASAGQKPPDVLTHYKELAEAYDLELIMRITADCPLLRSDLCRKVMMLRDVGDCQYIAIGHPQGGYPKGYGCEVFTRDALNEAHRWARGAQREHVTPAMEDRCRPVYLQNDKDESHLNYSIDTPEDLERVRIIVQKSTEASYI
jgi:spore coat polysaccharide biosynthesis protein SpsF